ncbi:MAG: response regulator [Azonexus sp.]|nr:response regulator [Azonexus sp.]MCK6413440.1 response regulator [Azonexus sp.]
MTNDSFIEAIHAGLEALEKQEKIHDKCEHASEKLSMIFLAIEQNPLSTLITNARGEICYANRALCLTSGYSLEELIGQSPRLFKSGKTPPAVFTRLWSTISSGKTWRGEIINRRKDGECYTEYEIIVPVFDNKGGIVYYVDIKEDITEKKRTKKELERHRRHLEDLVKERTAALDKTNHALAHALDAAQHAAEAKSAFLANMSHEIRTPLSAVLGMTHIMRRNATAWQLSQLDKIETAGRHLLGIVNDILDLSKIEAGKISMEMIEFPIRDTINSALLIFSDAAYNKGIDIRFVDNENLPDFACGDPTRLSQILINYLSNAIKFTHSGNILIRAYLQDETENSTTLKFEVQDSGVGITPGAIQNLFEDFSQGDSSITRRHGGTGLGLSISRRLAKLMNGTVGAESIPSGGSLFWFTCRLAKPEKSDRRSMAEIQQIPDAQEKLRKNFAGNRILLVEDEPIIREVTRSLLEESGLEVDEAENGVQAVTLIKTKKYDLVLMDLQMPTLDGIEATRCIRKLSSTQDIPIIAMTANAFDEDRERCLAAGMNDFLKKPINPDRFNSKLLHWLSKK